MESSEEIKKVVREKYGEIAEQSKARNQSSCCGSTCGCSPEAEVSVIADDYAKVPGYVPEADLALGCGLPTQFAQIKKGDTVVDLGSGAGNDCFIARSVAGDAGRVIGVDMTEAMVRKARENAAKLGYTNVEFRLGDIENLPVGDNTADVVVSNCVMNLVPDKGKAFAETYRILKPSGHFSISDIVLQGELPEAVRREAALYAGCISGAMQKEDYLDVIRKAGFTGVTVQQERKTDIPEEILREYVSEADIRELRERRVGIFSVTVFAEKPA